MNFCDIRVTVLLESYMILHGGCLVETENKICQISGPKSSRSRLWNLRSGRLRESFWNSVWLRNKLVICKVVAYGRWSLWESWLYWFTLQSCKILKGNQVLKLFSNVLYNIKKSLFGVSCTCLSIQYKNERETVKNCSSGATYMVIDRQLCWSHFKSRLSLIVQVNEVLNRTVVVDNDWCFDNMCGSHVER